jgi:putative transposase
MARPLRVECPGAVYHATARGDGRGAVFRDDADRAKFLDILGRTVKHRGWICHAYCLMGNHYHLLHHQPDRARWRIVKLPCGMARPDPAAQCGKT